MMREMPRLPLLFALVPAIALASAPTHSPTEIEVGTNPLAVEVAVGDRLVATLLGVDTSTVSWVDTADFSDGPFTATVAGENARTLVAGQVSGADALFVGGDQVDVLVFDVPTTPLTSPGEGTPALLGEGASVSSMLSRGELLWAADSGRGELHCIDWVSGVPQVDTVSEAWPLDLGFPPSDASWLDEDLMIVVGGVDSPVAALVDLTSLSAPVVTSLDLDSLFAVPVAVAGDGAGQAWVLEPGGDLWIVETDLLGDDDDAGDDDDSAGDDDDSAGDDDDSADSGPSGPGPSVGWSVGLLASGLPSPAVDVTWRAEDLWPTLLVLGDNDVAVLDDFGFEWDRIALSTAGTGLAMASSADGFAYASVGGTGQVAVLAPGPWLRFNSISTQALSTDDEVIDVTFTVDLGEGGGTCDYEGVLDATIAGGGTAISGLTGTATHGEQVDVSISGASLSSGSHRVWLFCTDFFGDTGRASFAYYKGGLTAPTGFSASRGNGQVSLTWTASDDTSVASYRVYFSDTEFTDADTPTTCNSDGTDCSGFTVDADESAGDDDDSAETTDGDFSRIITNLTNGQTYWFALSAVDIDGNESARTEVLSATPTVSGGAAALAGEPQGCSCTHAPAAPTGLLLLGLLGILRLRRNTQ